MKGNAISLTATLALITLYQRADGCQRHNQGSSVNTVITFDDLVRMDNCVLTANQHLVSFDCRGAGKP
jgi:hypothetical protein